MRLVDRLRSELLLLLIASAPIAACSQQYISEPRFDSLDTRHDMKRTLVERYWITSNHVWACFNLGHTAETRKGAREELELAELLGADSLLAQAYLHLGNAFSGSADPGLMLKYDYKAREYAEAAGSRQYIGIADKEIGTLHKTLGDYPRALQLLKQALVNVQTPKQINRTCCHLSECYRLMGKPDPALYFAQRSNITARPSDDTYGYARSYFVLGAAYAAKGDHELAEVHFKRCIEVADSFHVMIPLYNALVGRGRMHLGMNDVGGAIADGVHGLAVSRGGGELSGMIDATDLLREAYKTSGQLDSAYHYFELKSLYTDSLKSTSNLNKLQNMVFAQDLKEREDAQTRAEEVAARSHNIQFGIIALMVITLAIFLLVFSRTAIVGARAIKNLSLIALLLFFEFINLLLHPVLDRFTNGSPLFMILIMAAIAGLLIPLHHRMEKLITNMLVSKNNRVRLEAARRTIEELEARPSDANAT